MVVGWRGRLAGLVCGTLPFIRCGPLSHWAASVIQAAPRDRLPQISVLGVSLVLLIRSADQQVPNGRERTSPGKYSLPTSRGWMPIKKTCPRRWRGDATACVDKLGILSSGSQAEVKLLLFLFSEELSLTPELPGAESKLVAS